MIVNRFSEMLGRIVEKIRVPKHSGMDGPMHRALPPIPKPKVREKAKYRIMIINESGRSRQVELTRSRLILISSAIAGLIVIIALIVVLPARYAWRNTELATRTDLQRPSGMAVKEPPLTQGRDATTTPPPVSAVTQPPSEAARPAGEVPRAGGSGRSDGGDTAEIARTPDPSSVTTGGAGKDNQDPGNTVDSGTVTQESQPQDTTKAASEKPDGAAASVTRVPIISFNAQDVLAAPDSVGSGTLSFRLVKDQPEVRFAGYLFVYVEMEDKSGENKIYVYPRQTRLGEGDLPFDFKEGESIAFKYNSRVELPYADTRAGASLAGVSILLYGENGKIVFQRSFGRQELTVASPKSVKPERAKSRSGDKRQAL